LEALTFGPGASDQPKETAANRAMHEFFRLMLVRDWDRVKALIAPDIEWIDRRATLGVHITDADTYLENLRNIIRLGVTTVDATVVATRGEEHQLARTVFHGDTADGDRGEVVVLHVNEFDAQGRIRYSSNFDPDDRAAAFEHLDERYIASLPVDRAEVASVGVRFVRSYNHRSWDEHFGLLSDEFESVDHRPAGQGRLDRDSFERLVRGLVDVASDTRIEIIELAEVTADGFVGITMLRGSGDLVGASELHRAQLVLVRDGRITRLENWQPEDADAAVAHLRAPRPASAPRAGLVNAAMRAVRKGRDLLLAGAFDDLVNTWAADAQIVDRRPFAQFTAVGVDEFMAVSRSILEGGVREINHLPIAIRGERLVLSETHFAGMRRDGARNETVALSLDEFDESGRRMRLTLFERNQLEEAFAELEARYGAGEGAGHPSIALADRALGLWRAGEWGALRARFHDDAAVVDHRTVGWGSVDADAFVARSAAFSELTTKTALYATSLVRIHSTAVLATMWGTGTNPDGVDIERSFVMIMTFDGERISRLETFEVDDLDAAVRHFEDVTKQPDGPVIPPNEASRITHRFNELFAARDLEGLAEFVSDDFVMEDRRAATRNVVRGRQAFIENNRLMTDVTQRAMTLLGTRGERLALIQSVWRGEISGRGPFEVE
ncbi:MAG: hypothetical protein H0X05_07645, partial [Actinobacteria bacterium]|nr:hypothetical protein [Actinomycetota bacterium]